MNCLEFRRFLPIFALIFAQNVFASFPDEWETRVFSRVCDHELPAEPKISGADFYQESLEKYACRYKKPQSYLNLAQALIRFRPQARSHEDLYRLAVMSDSVLYAYHLFFPTEPAFFEMRNEAIKAKCSDLPYGAPICAGDIALSKSDSFSASLFQFRSRFEYSFSHAALVDRLEKTGELKFIQTDVFENGPFVPTDKPMPEKLSVYRLNGKSLATKKATRKLETAKLGFNFTLKPSCENGKYFCSEMIYCMFPDNAQNPYFSKNWGDVDSDGTKFLDALGGKLYQGKIPFPGDIELNPNYTWVFHIIQTDQLAQSRIQYALVESFIELMKKDPKLQSDYLIALDRLGKKKIQEKTGDQLLAIGRDKWKVEDFISYFKNQGPKELDLKEVLFYFHFQSFVLPTVQAELAKSINTKPIMLTELVTLIDPILRKEIAKLISQSHVF